MTNLNTKVAAHKGKLLVLLPGMGAVGTTCIAGVEAVRRGLAKPIGSVTQMQTIRIGKVSDNNHPLIRDFVGLAPLEDLKFAGWDVIADDAFAAATRAGVLTSKDLDPIADYLRGIKPMKAAFSQEYVKNLKGDNIKPGDNKFEWAESLREDIRTAIKNAGADRAVMVWCGSTETHMETGVCHKDFDSFVAGMKANDKAISPSQLYAYAAIMEGVPYANGAPNLSADFPALERLAIEKKVPLCGKDFKTGQTLLKTTLAPALKARMLGVRGWFSTNILGNRDGEILDDPESFRAKEVTKSAALNCIFQPEVYPDLYGSLYHKVRIDYYPPRGDDKEGWDNIDIIGWMGYPMQIKLNFLCKDSILAAPLVLDLALLLDLAGRAELGGIQEWLSFFFKAPHTAPGHLQEHDIFIQHIRLKNTLRVLGGEDPVTHLPEDFD